MNDYLHQGDYEERFTYTTVWTMMGAGANLAGELVGDQGVKGFAREHLSIPGMEVNVVIGALDHGE